MITTPTRTRPRVDRRRGDVNSARRPGLWARLWRPFWAIPVAAVVVATVVGYLAPHLEGQAYDHLDEVTWWLFSGSADSARGILSTIASAMISVTGLVFSLTLVVLQLASSQFTPRLVGVFLSSRIVQCTLAVFMSSFVYSLAVLRSVRAEEAVGSAFVPRLCVTVAFLLVLTSMGCFLAFIHHVTSSIHVATVISRVGDTTMAEIDRSYPEEGTDEVGPSWAPRPGTPRTLVHARERHGRLTYVDHVELAKVAARYDVVVALTVREGDFVPDDAVVAHIWGELPEGDVEKVQGLVTKAVTLGTESDLDDVAFGLRQLLDIAVRALSPGVNDPTTAIQAINEIHRILRRLVQRLTPSAYVTYDDQVRVVQRPCTVEDLLDLAVPELAFHGEGTARIPRTLHDMVADLRLVALPRYRGVLDRLATALPPDPLEDTP